MKLSFYIEKMTNTEDEMNKSRKTHLGMVDLDANRSLSYYFVIAAGFLNMLKAEDFMFEVNMLHMRQLPQVKNDRCNVM